jgi:hypothetical protein
VYGRRSTCPATNNADVDLTVGACLDAIQIPIFFTLSITSIFNRLHGVLNVGKKNN